VRVLFSTEPASGLLNHESVLRELVARGHEVTVAVHGNTDEPFLRRLSTELRGITVEAALPPRGDRWLELAADLRSSIDLLAFGEPWFNDTYRARSWRRAPKPVQALASTGLLRLTPLRRGLRRLLELIERLVPTNAELERYLVARHPDVILFTPYVGLRTMQADYLRAAQALGLRTAICVKSWDNLTSKAAIRPVPERVFVWNETQRKEAIRLHRVPAERIVVTGAQCFDHWLVAQPTQRERFLAGVGLDPERPVVLYVCCAPWNGQSELPFVHRWIDALRAAPRDSVARAGILVRPHPKRPEEWFGVDLGADVAVWPVDAAAPSDDGGRQVYLDSIHHSAAVVGLNTSAMLEAGLLGRPVLTVLDPEYRNVQEDTLHFRYLLEVGGGLVQVARTLGEHVDQLGRVVEGEWDPSRAQAFVRAFLRPVEGRATDVFVDAVEGLAVAPAPQPTRTPRSLRPLRLLLAPLATRSARAA
jgi:hypothetical protein